MPVLRIITLALLASAPALPAAAQAQAQTQAQRPAAQAARTAQPVTRAVFIQNLDNAFAGVDTNKDGFADRAEIEASEAKALAARKANVLSERERAFKTLDKDNSGTLTLAEFNAVAAAQPLPRADASQELARLDTNKDGRISREENRAIAVAQFDRADANRDGTVTPAEAAAARPRQ
jgi:hypothetical protein